MLIINFVWIGLFIIIGGLLFLLHNILGLDLFSKHDNKVIEKFLEKYPDVFPSYMTKGLREQNIENNQEIHELNKRITELEKRLKNG